MVFAVSSLDVYYLVRELRPLLQDAFVDKVYQGKEEKGDFLMRMRSPQHGKLQLYAQVPEAFFLTEHRFSWPTSPPGFCMQLRKHLTNAKVVSIEQHAFERVVELTFQKGPVVWKLVFELFSKGNVVLVNSDGLIRGVMDLQRWKDRTLRVNAMYEYPPALVNTSSLSVEELHKLFVESKRELVKFCAAKLGLGGKYAEELVATTGLDKLKKDLSLDEATLLHVKLQELLNHPLQPKVTKSDAAPFTLQSWSGSSDAESFSAAIESLIVQEKISSVEDESSGVVANAKNKFQRIIDEQSKKLAGYESAAVENQRKGELIYEKYQELSALLEQVNKLHDKDGWSAVKEFIKEKKLPVVVNEKSGSITVLFDD